MADHETTSSDPTVVPSSIALLQERFRQLQRVKQKREEREIMQRWLSTSLRPSPTISPFPLLMNNAHGNHSPKEHLLQGNNYEQQSNLRSGTVQPGRPTPWPRDHAGGGGVSSGRFTNSDHVDTSLHL